MICRMGSRVVEVEMDVKCDDSVPDRGEVCLVMYVCMRVCVYVSMYCVRVTEVFLPLV